MKYQETFIFIFLFHSFQPFIIVAIFYIVILTICVLGQTAIWIKKFIEYYKERKAQNKVNIMMTQINQPANIAINNKHWNHQICNNYGLIVLIVILFVLVLAQFVGRFKLNQMFSSWKNLTFEEKAHLYDNIEFVLFTIGIPLIIYIKNEKIRKHVVDEIKDIFHVYRKCE